MEGASRQHPGAWPPGCRAAGLPSPLPCPPPPLPLQAFLAAARAEKAATAAASAEEGEGESEGEGEGEGGSPKKSGSGASTIKGSGTSSQGSEAGAAPGAAGFDDDDAALEERFDAVAAYNEQTGGIATLHGHSHSKASGWEDGGCQWGQAPRQAMAARLPLLAAAGCGCSWCAPDRPCWCSDRLRTPSDAPLHTIPTLQIPMVRVPRNNWLGLVLHIAFMAW